jgi:outer membrane protein OmpA-like peptidoglycan-associated protein
MMFRHTLRHLSWLAVLGLGFLAVGCVIEDPQAIKDIAKARTALDDAKKTGTAEKCPGEFATLEKRYLEARGVYYACQDAKASDLARAIVTDLGKCAPPPPPPAPVRPPVSSCTTPAQGQVGQAVPLDGSGSSDPAGNALTYNWDFGDGTNPASFTFPRTTHTYNRPGNFTVRLTVDNGRPGGTATTTCGPVQVIQRLVLSERGGKALFDFNKATLKPAAIQALAPVVQAMKADPTLQADFVGHTDSVGSAQYNLELSRRRADAVKNYMVSQGIAANRMRTEGRGKSEPEVPNTSAANRAQNRRVVVTLSGQ